VEIKFSVVCPAYNCEEYIYTTLESAVCQTHKPDEVVITDDGSSDRTVEVVEQFMTNHPLANIRFFKSAHKGSAGYGRNNGIQNSRNEWIAFLDADDLWQPNKLEAVAKTIESNRQANFFCHSEVFLKNGLQVGVLEYFRDFDPDQELFSQLYWRNLFSTSAVVCRKDLLEAAGFFKEDLFSAQDYEMWLRMSPLIRPVFLKEVLGVYNMRAGNITSSKLMRRYKDVMSVLHAHRDKVSVPVYVARSAKTTAAFLRDYIKR